MTDSATEAQNPGYVALIAKLAVFRNDQLERQPSDRTLSKAARVSPTTIGAWLRGDQFPQQVDPLLRIVQAVRVQANRIGLAHDKESAALLDSERWRRAYQAEARSRANGTRAAVQAEQGRAVLEQLRPGRPLEQVTDPFDLEVHHAIGSGLTGLPELPVYVPREHDQLLGEVVERVAAGSSGIAVLVGGSSTGKTRACWEALQLLREKPESWRLWHPIDPTRHDAALADLAQIGPYTAVWLNEAQFYFTDPVLGERIAAGLRALLRDPDRSPVLVLATLWPAHWDTLTTRTDADIHAQARELLYGHKIKVPGAFTGTDLGTLAIKATGDPRLAEAIARAIDGQVTQYLAGVPVLMDRYEEAPPATKALIHAAMDARRLGCGPRVPLALLARAAPGYLSDIEWEQTGEDWLQQALAYLTRPCHGVPGILTAVKSGSARNRRTSCSTTGHVAWTASGPLYRLADYLDQYGRRHRADTIPPIDFWTAAASHAHPDDLRALGDSAWVRGLYRDAAQLHKRATAHGNPYAAAALVHHLHNLDPADDRPAQWAAAHSRLDDPGAVAWLLNSLRRAGFRDQATSLVVRDPAVHASLDDPGSVAKLLEALGNASAHDQVTVLLARDPGIGAAHDAPYSTAMLVNALRRAGADEQATALANRVAAQTPLDHPGKMWMLVDALSYAGADEQATALADRVANQTPLDDPYLVAALLDALSHAGADEQATALADRVANQTPLDDPYSVAMLVKVLRRAGADEQATALVNRIAAQTPLDDPNNMTMLVEVLRYAGAHEQATALANRVANQTRLDDPYSVAMLVNALRQAGADEQATALANRAAIQTPLEDPRAVATLLGALREAGAHAQVTTLLARDPAAHGSLDDPDAVTALLRAMRMTGASDPITTLANRAGAQTPLDDPLAVAKLLAALREAGAHAQVTTLLARDPAAHVTVQNPGTVAVLLNALWHAGAHDQVAALANRAATQTSLDRPGAAAWLLDAMWKAGAHDQVATLANRAASHTPLHKSEAAVMLLGWLQALGAVEQAVRLAERLSATGQFDLFVRVSDQRERFRFGREPDGSVATPWAWDDLE